jgi:hypothetical protein
MNQIIRQKEFKINLCGEHIGGLLGEAVLQFFLREKLILKDNKDKYYITDKGWEDLEIIGIDIDKLKLSNNKIINICLKSKDGILFEHIGSKLGTLLFEKFIELEWLKRTNDNRIILSNRGILGLESLGVKTKRYHLI